MATTKRPLSDLEIDRRIAEEKRRQLLAKQEDATEKAKRKARGILDLFRRKARA
jgi:hypothetical protein